MFLTPSLVLFLSSILVSVLLVMSSASLIMFWVGLELNTLAFIPFLMMEKNKLSSESSIKYFLTQTLASLLFILGVIGETFMLNETYASYMLMVGLAIKLGAAPFHSWLPSVSKNCAWISLFVLLTIQKINPLVIMWGLKSTDFMLFSFVVASSLIVGGLMGLIQTDTRLLLAYSSISHVGWLLVGLLYSFYLGFIYYVSYLAVLLPLILIFQETNVNFNSIHLHQNKMSLVNLSMLYCLLYSLGGLPPFLGFLPKWMVLQSVVASGFFIFSSLMILMSLFTLFYYIRLGITAFMLTSTKTNMIFDKSYIGSVTSSLASFSFFGLPFIFLM